MQEHDNPLVEVIPGLAEQLEEQGFRPGAPGHVTEATKDVDRQICRVLKCPHCRRLGMEYRPFHKGSRYRVVALCCHCGTEEEA